MSPEFTCLVSTLVMADAGTLMDQPADTGLPSDWSGTATAAAQHHGGNLLS